MRIVAQLIFNVKMKRNKIAMNEFGSKVWPICLPSCLISSYHSPRGTQARKSEMTWPWGEQKRAAEATVRRSCVTFL